jgi:hypothetical protein
MLFSRRIVVFFGLNKCLKAALRSACDGHLSSFNPQKVLRPDAFECRLKFWKSVCGPKTCKGWRTDHRAT